MCWISLSLDGSRVRSHRAERRRARGVYNSSSYDVSIAMALVGFLCALASDTNVSSYARHTWALRFETVFRAGPHVALALCARPPAFVMSSTGAPANRAKRTRRVLPEGCRDGGDGHAPGEVPTDACSRGDVSGSPAQPVVPTTGAGHLDDCAMGSAPPKRRRLWGKTRCEGVLQESGGAFLPSTTSPRDGLTEHGPCEETRVDPASELLSFLKAEVYETECRLLLAGAQGRMDGVQSVRCPLCPWFTARTASERMRKHFSEGHSLGKQYVSSGTKQLRVCMSMFESDKFRGTFLGGYLCRSSQILRETVVPGAPPSTECIDRYLRLVLDGDGPRMVSAHGDILGTPVRRVGNIIYTRSFAEVFLREMCQCRYSLREALSRLQSTFLLAGCSLGSLMPEHGKTMMLVLEDILQGECVKQWQKALVDGAWKAGEYRVLTVDGTMKIALGTKGYKRGRAAALADTTSDSMGSAWGAGARPPRVLTVRGGLSGFVFGAPLVRGEAASEIAAALGDLLPEESRRLVVEYVTVDHSTRELYQELLQVFPRLRCLCQDTTHLVMKMKSASGNQVTAGSRFLSSIMAKFNRPLPSKGSRGDLTWWTWGTAPATRREETRLLGHVKTGDLPARLLAEADHMLEGEGPWTSYRDYLLAMAALTTRFSGEMRRRTDKKGTPVSRIILAACAYARWGSYYNNVLLRTDIGTSGNFLSSGTTANEALHAELRNAFRQVYSVHVPTLQTRLKTFVLAKQVAWDAARRTPGLRQRSQQAVLFRALARPLFDESLWNYWAAPSDGALVVAKAPDAPRALLRSHVDSVRRWMGARASEGARRPPKRTVFTQPRAHHLTGGGTRWGSRGAGTKSIMR